jgi:hypothetical protein
MALAFSFCFFAARKKGQRVFSARAARNPHLGVELAKTDEIILRSYVLREDSTKTFLCNVN